MDEMNSLSKNGTWFPVKKLAKNSLVGNKWVFKLKEGIKWVESTRNKARVIA